MKKSLLSILFVLLFSAVTGIVSAQSVLLEENFETVAGSLPVGWTTENSASKDWRSFTEENGNNSLWFDGRYSYNRGGSSVVTDWVEIPYAQYGLSFRYNNDANVTFEVYVISSDGIETILRNSSTNGYIRSEYDLTPFMGKRIRVQFYAFSNEYARPNCSGMGCDWSAKEYHGLWLDDIRIAIQPACASVSALYATEVTETTATLTWGNGAFGAQPLNYIVTVKDEQFNLVNEITTPFNMVTLTSLDPVTTYYVYVRGDCTAAQKGMGAQSNRFSFTTDGGYVTFPFYEDFDLVTTTMPDAWRWNEACRENTYLQNSVVKDGMGRAVALVTDNTCNGILVTPSIRHEVSDMEITFAYYPKDEEVTFGVGVLSNKADMTTYDELYRFTTTSDQKRKWQSLTIPTSNTVYTGQDMVVAIVNYSAGTVMYVDNVDIHLPSTSCPAPSALEVKSVEANTAKISFYAWGVDGTVTIEVAKNAAFTNAQTFTCASTEYEYLIEGIDDNSDYYCRVYSTCNGVKTAYSNTVTFTTKLAPITIEQFNSTYNASEVATLPAGWQVIVGQDFSGMGENMWNITSCNDYTRNKSAYALQFACPNNVECNINASSITVNPGSAALVTPAVLIPEGEDSYGIEFYMNRNSKDNHSNLTLYVNTEPTLDGAVMLKTITDMDAAANIADNAYVLQNAVFPSSFKGKAVHIMFVGTKIPNANKYWPNRALRIDDLTIKTMDACPFTSTTLTATNVTATTATVEWNDNDGNSAYHILYTLMLKADGSVISQDEADVTSNSYEFSGLAANTEYEVEIQVVAVCNNGADHSQVQTVTTTFKTTLACGEAIELPFSENFESYTGATNQANAWKLVTNQETMEGTHLPTCWEVVPGAEPDNSSNGTKYPYYAKMPWFICTGQITFAQPDKNNKAVALYAYSTSTYGVQNLGISILSMGKFSFPSTGGKVKFRYFQVKSASYDPSEVNVYLSKSSSSVDGATLLGTVYGISTTDATAWHNVEYEFNNGGEYYVVLAVDRAPAAKRQQIMIDDISIEGNPACDPLDDIAVVGTTATTGSVQITGSFDYWDVALSTTNNIEDAQIRTIEEEATVYTFVGLTPNVTYYAWARNNCSATMGNGIASTWVGPVEFTPTCTPELVTSTTPFVDNFETSFNNCYAVNSNSDDITVELCNEHQSGSRSAKVSGGKFTTTISRDFEFEDGNYAFSLFTKAVGSVSGKMTLKNESGTVVATFYNGMVATSWDEWQGYYEATAGVYTLTIEARAAAQTDEFCFDYLEVKAIDCVPPSSLIATNLDQTVADLVLTAASGLSWEVVVSTTEQTGDNKSGNVYSQTLTQAGIINLTGLTSATKYYAYARTNCEGGAKSEWIDLEFFTKCGVVNAPLVESFADENLTDFHCWYQLGSGEYSHTTAQAFDQDGASLLVNGYTLVSPQMNVTSLKDYSLNGYVYSLGNNTSVDLGVVLDPNDITTYERISRLDIVEAGEWLEFNIDFSILEDNPALADFKDAKHFAIVPSSGVTFYFDKIRFDATPACGKPANVVVDNITGSAARVSFVSKANNFSYKLHRFTVGSATVDSTFTATDNPHIITGLIPHTKYWLEIATICEDNSTSDYLYAGRFETPCADVAVPWYEDFELGAALDLTDQCYFFKATSVDDVEPYAVTSKVLEDRKDILSINGTYSLELNTNTDPFYLSLPPFAEPLNNLKLEFYYRYLLGLDEYPSVELGLIDEMGAWDTFVPFTSYKPSIAHTKVSLELGQFVEPEDAHKVLCIRVYGESGVKLAFDDFYVNTIDGCSNIESVAIAADLPGQAVVTLSHPTAQEYEYELYKDEALVKSGSVNSSVITFTGLAGNEYYTLKVRALCSAGSKSFWAERTFRTMPLAASLPYTTNFSNQEDNSNWILESGDYGYHFFTGNGLYVGYYDTRNNNVPTYGFCYWQDGDFDDAGGGAQYGFLFPFSNEVIYAYRSVYVPQGRCTFTMSWEGRNNSAVERVLLVPTSVAIEGGANVFNIRGSFTDNHSAAPVSLPDNAAEADGNNFNTDYYYTLDLTAPYSLTSEFSVAQTGYYNIVVIWQHVRTNLSEGANSTLRINSMSLTSAPCSRTTAAKIAPTAVSATVTATNSAPVNEITYRYSTSNNFNNATEVTVQTSSQFVIEDLADNTTYYLWIIPTCAIGSGAEWYQTTFKTTIFPQTVPYSTGFENQAERGKWTLLNASGNNFVFTSDANGIKTGSYALYPSSNGSSYNYTTQNSGVNFAYTLLDFPAGDYEITFDYKTGYHTLNAEQESGEDGTGGTMNEKVGPAFARILLVPMSAELNPVKCLNSFGDPAACTPSYYASIATPSSVGSGVIALDGGEALVSDKAWSNYKGQFTVANDEQYRLLVMWTNSADYYFQDKGGSYYSGNPFTIDNLSIDFYKAPEIDPNACVKPHVEVADYSAIGVELKTANDMGFTTYYTYSTVDQAPANTSSCQVTTSDRFRILSLQPSTKYYFFVAFDCENTGLTQWTKVTFTTPCDGFIKVTENSPYHYGFEDYDTNDMLADYNCWQATSAATQTTVGEDPYHKSTYPVATAVPSKMSGGRVVATAKEGENVVIAYVQNNANPGMFYNTIYMEAGKTYTMSMYYGAACASSHTGAFGSFNADLIVKKETATSFEPFASASFDGGAGMDTYGASNGISSWHKVAGTYTPAESGLYNIGIQYLATPGGAFPQGAVMAFDDITIEVATVPAPMNIFASVTGTTIEASWTPVATAESYDVQLLNGAGDVVDAINTTTTSWVVTNLPGAQTYTVRVRTNQAGNSSNWVATEVTLACVNIIPPYVLTIPSVSPETQGTQDDFAPCWYATSPAIFNTKPYYGGWFTAQYRGTKAYYFHALYETVAAVQYDLVSPAFAITADNFVLKFSYTTDNATEAIVAFNVGISVDGGATICEQLVSTKKSMTDVLVTKDLAQYAGKEITLVARMISNGSDPAYSSPSKYLAYIYNMSIKCFSGEQNTAVDLCAGDMYEDEYFSVRADDLNAGEYYFTHYEEAEPGSGECDALYSLSVNVGTGNTLILSDTICYGSSYNRYGFVNLTEEGIYEVEVDNGGLCPDRVRLSLVVVPAREQMTVAICEGDRYVLGGQVFTESGTHEVEVPTNWDCSITKVLHLTVRPADYVDVKYMCEGDEPIVWHGREYSETGIYRIEGKTADRECDSNLVLDLTVLPTESYITEKICKGGTYVTVDNQVITEPGTYPFNYKNRLDCDSTVYLTIEWGDDLVGDIYDYACEGKLYEDYDYSGYFTEDGEFTQQLKNAEGCDSLLHVHIIYMATTYEEESRTIEYGESLTWNGDTYTTSGKYTRTLINDYGCDSVVTLNLTVKPKQEDPNPNDAVDNAYMLPLTIAPNPIRSSGTSFVSHQFTDLEKEGLKVFVTTTSGQVVRSFEPATYPIEIDKLYTSGIYYVRIITGTGETYIGKLVVK